MSGRIALLGLACACGRLGFEPLADDGSTASVTMPSAVRVGREVTVTIELAEALAGIEIELATSGVATSITQPMPTDASGRTSAVVRADAVGSFELVASVGETSSEPRAVIVQPAARLAFHFDEGTASAATDAVIAVPGTLLNGATWAPGVFGTAVLLDGMNDFVDMPRTPATYFDEYIDNMEVTVEVYARPGAVTGTWAAMYQLGGCANHVALGLDPQGHLVGSIMKDQSQTRLVAGAPLPLDTWSHVAVAKTIDALVLYTDGVEVARMAAPAIWNTGADIHMIGTSGGGESSLTPTCAPTQRDWFDGRLDELQVFDHAVAPDVLAVDATVPALQ